MPLKMLLTHFKPNLASSRNQSIDLQSKSTDWFQWDGNFNLKWVTTSYNVFKNIMKP